MNLTEARQLFPEGSPYPDVIEGLASDDREARQGALEAMRKRQLIRPYWAEPEPIAPELAFAVLRAAVEVQFPAPADRWERGPEDLIFTILGSVTPAMVGYVGERFAAAPQRMQLPLLTLVASAATRPGAELFVRLIGEHGWPVRVHQRFYAELARNVPHADALFPALLETDGASWMSLGDVVLQALRAGSLDPATLSDTGVVRQLEPRLRVLIEERAKRDPDAPPSDDDHLEASELELLLDLAGFVGEASVVGPLRETVAADHGRSGAFAIASLLRRGEDVADASIEHVAANDAVRNTIYALLRELDAEARIPARLRDRDAFAAADMVQWLAHPGELGRPPDAIELMQTFEASRDGEPVVLYVWRFRVGDDPWLASTSGPYPKDPPEGPLRGESTFSRFEGWDVATAEEHALAILKNLDEWREAHADR